MNKYFPKSEETQFGHMSGQWQGVRSTKKVPSKKDKPHKEERESKPVEEKCDIFIKNFNVQESIDEGGTSKTKSKMPSTLTKWESSPMSPDETTSNKWYSITSTVTPSGWWLTNIEPRVK